MKTPDPVEKRLIEEARETATQLRDAGVLSDEDLHAVAKISEQPSSPDTLTQLTAKQHAAVAKARPGRRGKVVSALPGVASED